jgi:hypothetical protein
MSINFKMHRLLCSTPPDLESERLVFEERLAKFSEHVTMPAGVLFPAAMFRPDFDLNRQRYAIESNIRMVEFFVQILGESMPDPVFEGFVNLALKCVADAAFPLRQATILFKRSSAAPPALERLRKTLAADPRCELREYGDEQELADQIRATLEGWYRLIQP